MKQITLLKQRMIGREKEPEEFLALKRDVVLRRDSMMRVLSALKSWLDGMKGLEKSCQTMSKVLEGADPDLDLLAKSVANGIMNTKSGAGVAEVAVDSINKKIVWMNSLLKQCDTLDTNHLELARAKRKYAEAEKKGDAARTAESLQVLNKAQATYDTLFNELLGSFRFIIQEGGTGAIPALGLVEKELAGFKQSQIAFFADCSSATSQFRTVGADSSSSGEMDLSHVWDDFCERRIAAVSALAGSAGTMTASRSPSTRDLSQSGRNLLRQGLSEDGEGYPSASRPAPPPPPPPPPAPGRPQMPPRPPPTARVLYAYDPTSADEIEIVEGQIVTVIKKNDDGWWEVQNQATGARGVVPSNYLEEEGGSGSFGV